MGKEEEDRTKLENKEKDTQVPTKLQIYLWYRIFPKNVGGRGQTPPPNVCVREKQGRKIKSQNEGGEKKSN